MGSFFVFVVINCCFHGFLISAMFLCKENTRSFTVGVKVPLILFAVWLIYDFAFYSLSGIQNQENHVEALRLVQKYFDGSCTDQSMK